MKKIALTIAAVISLAGCTPSGRESAVTKKTETSSAEESSAVITTVVSEAEDSSESPESDASYDDSNTNIEPTDAEDSIFGKPGILKSADDIDLHDIDGNGENYAFTYNGEEIYAYYTPDNWKIVDSYKVDSRDDIFIICGALSEIHPIHGSDGESYRQPDDMAAEWFVHNLAYLVLPEDDNRKQNAKDVDLDPEDQDKTVYDFYRKRILGE